MCGATSSRRLEAALPDEAFEARRIVTIRSNSLSLVRFRGSTATTTSVPVMWAHHPLTVVGGIETVRVWAGSEVVAEHPRDWGREAVRYDPVHYLALLERRPGASSTGIGKTHLVLLGVEACQRGKRVRFCRVTELITQMMEARVERMLTRIKGQLAKLDLLPG